MFRPGESVCVSNSQYAYHAISLENALSDKVTLVSPNSKVPIRKVDSNELLLVSLNPIDGWRNDLNVKAYRNILVEIDTGSLKEQYDYINNIMMPYSASVFSGGKSLHFLVSLDTDLPNETIYRAFAEWTFKIATLADPDCKNPSRCIRIPGAEREKGKFQKLVELKGQVKLSDFVNWLHRYPHLKPTKHESKMPSETPNIDKVKPWAINKLVKGLDPNKGRNTQWYAIAYEFGLAGYSESDIIDTLLGFFVEERDFSKKELLSTIKSAYRHIYSRS